MTPTLKFESPKFDELTGDLRATAATAVTGGVRAGTRGLTLDMRQMVHSAGLGDRLPNALRTVVYPDAPKVSLRAAGEVVPNGGGAWTIFDAFSSGVTIRARNGSRYIAIPTENVPRQMLRERFGSVSPLAVESWINGDLRFVPVRPGLALLVRDNVVAAKSGKGFRAATPKRIAQGRGLASVVMFYLVPQASLRKRLDFDALGQRWADRLPDLIAAAWPEGSRNGA